MTGSPADKMGHERSQDRAATRSVEHVRPNVPPGTEHVVSREEPAPSASLPTSGDDSKVICARLYQPDAPSHVIPLREVPQAIVPEEAFVWIDLSAYTADDLHMVARTLHLDRVIVHATLAAWTRPQLEVFDEQFYVSATVPTLDLTTYRIEARQLDLVGGRNYLVSAHKTPLPFAGRVLDRAAKSPALLHDDAAYMLYILLDEALAHYEGFVERLQGETEAMQQRALTDTSDDFLPALVHLKRFAFAVSELAVQHREVFAAFLRPDFAWVSGTDVDVSFRDLNARLARLIDELRAITSGLNDAFDIYVSQMSHRTNQVVKVLTIVSTTLLPITVILAFFGTNNIQSIPLLTHTGGFLIEIAVIVVISASILGIFHRNRWL